MNIWGKESRTTVEQAVLNRIGAAFQGISRHLGDDTPPVPIPKRRLPALSDLSRPNIIRAALIVLLVIAVIAVATILIRRYCRRLY